MIMMVLVNVFASRTTGRGMHRAHSHDPIQNGAAGVVHSHKLFLKNLSMPIPTDTNAKQCLQLP